MSEMADVTDAETAQLEELSATLDRLPTATHDKALHLRAIELARALGMDDAAANAREQAAARFDLDDATWLEWIEDTRKAADLSTLEGVMSLLVLYDRALAGNLGACLADFTVRLLRGRLSAGRSYLARESISTSAGSSDSAIAPRAASSRRRYRLCHLTRL